MNSTKTLNYVNCSGCRGQGWFKSSTSGLLTKCPKCRGLGHVTKKQEDLVFVFSNKKEDLSKQPDSSKLFRRNISSLFSYLASTSKSIFKNNLKIKSHEHKS